MSDSGFSPAPAATGRPGTVTISSYLLYAAAALTLVNAVIALSSVGTTADVISDAYQGTAAEGAEGVAVGISVAGAALNVLFSVALVVLAVFNGRGRNPSRIITWVLGGLGVCCGGIGALSSAVSSSVNMGSASGPGVPDAAETQRRLADALPGWYTPVTTTLSVLSLLCLLAAVILLALPASNAFFRKPDPTWNPAQPGYPGYPPSPYPAAQYPAAPQQAAPQQAGPQSPAVPNQFPPNQVPPNQVPPNQVPPNQVPPNQVPPNQVPPGQVPPGQVPPGQVPPGQVPPGPASPGGWERPDDRQPPTA